MMMAVAKDFDEYLAAVPEPARTTLEKLRKTIRAAVPDATEAISYRMPTFKYRGKPLIALAAAKDHCSLHRWATFRPSWKPTSRDTTRGRAPSDSRRTSRCPRCWSGRWSRYGSL
jgi:hypothetical protein